ncbi:unnamed protein product [Heligmosomoides polygyrus]|uniref:Secreted protein n=1 Tax=Heligmosomoides polygyrus TaxID=6339 RepID=A0A183F4V2_HELPZ|nr:unnamed protein product [Heligmosomoides polygyrus]
MWAWTLFRATIKIPEGVGKVELAVKATDRTLGWRPVRPPMASTSSATVIPPPEEAPAVMCTWAEQVTMARR